MNEKDLKTMINQAFNDAFGCQTEESRGTEQSARLYNDAEDYRQRTGKRFRMTKQELDQYGQTPEGRQQAFLARQTAGKL
jgi:hypothetical protein